MKAYNFKIFLAGIAVLSIILSSCKKESENLFTIFKGLKIDFTKALASDEVYLEFNLNKPSSGAIMAKVNVTETGSTTIVYSRDISFTDRFSYSSGVIILKSNNPSAVSYKITVLDDLGNDISSNVNISYPAGRQVVSEPLLISDKENATFDAGTTVYIDYNITSEDANIKTIWLESYATGSPEPSRVTIATLPNNIIENRIYRGAVRVNLNRDGGSKYRIYVTNDANDYIGDGYTAINTTVRTSYELAANKFIYAPDFDATVANPDINATSFYSISKKKSYSYTEASQNSADIDFGIYLSRISTSNSFFLNFYSPLDTTNPVSQIYNVSNWTTKRGTRYSSALPSDAATIFNSIMVSGPAIRTQASIYSILTTRNRVTNVRVGSIIYFRTPENKSGAIFINGFGRDYLGKYYVNIDVKIEK